MTSFEPYEHQLLAQPILENMDRIGSGGFLCDEMGLGKTATMCMYMISRKINDKVDLIVCPNSLISTWIEWLEKIYKWHTDDNTKKINIYIYHGPKRNKNLIELSKYDVIITTYSILSTNELENKKWGRIVLDESHTIKNGIGRSCPKCASAAFRISKNAVSKFCITGTPFNNRISDIASQALFVGTAPYNDPKWWSVNNMNSDEIENWRTKFVLRRTKENMLKIPEYHTIYVDPTDKETELINILRSEAHDQFKKWKEAKMNKNNLERIRIQGVILGLIQRLRITSVTFYTEKDNVKPSKIMQDNSKLSKIVNDLDLLINKDPQKGVVLFSQFTSCLAIFSKVIKYKLPDVEIINFNGQMSTMERDIAISYFNTQNTRRVLLISLMAGSTGLSLHKGSSTIILAEPYYNPFIEQQAEERVHRLGQEEQVNIYRYYMNNSVESWLNGLKDKKKVLAGDIQFINKAYIPVRFDFNSIKQMFDAHVGFTTRDIKYTSVKSEYPKKRNKKQPPIKTKIKSN